MQRPLHVATLLAAVLAAGCQRGQGPATTAGHAGEAANAMHKQDQAFMLEEQAWRNDRRQRLLQPDGWTSLVGLHWIDEGPHFVGSGGDNGIRLAMGPEHMGMIELRKDGSVHFVPAKDAALTSTANRCRARPCCVPTWIRRGRARSASTRARAWRP